MMEIEIRIIKEKRGKKGKKHEAVSSCMRFFLFFIFYFNRVSSQVWPSVKVMNSVMMAIPIRLLKLKVGLHYMLTVKSRFMCESAYKGVWTSFYP